MKEVYSESYSEPKFWAKLTHAVKAAGAETLRLALKLYFAAADADTPAWAKTTIYSALGYFICTIDAIPDLTPVLGFSDDLGALTLALATVASHIKPEHIEQADEKMKTWFPSPSEVDQNSTK